jgi:hypothetical protein
MSHLIDIYRRRVDREFSSSSLLPRTTFALQKAKRRFVTRLVLLGRAAIFSNKMVYSLQDYPCKSRLFGKG